MDLRLSWDLFILVFFGIIVAYSFIIGQNGNLKVIIATYIGALCADGIGNLVGSVLTKSGNVMKLLSLFHVNDPEQAIVLAKVIAFISIIVLLSVRGAYEVDADMGSTMGTRMMVNLMFGVLNAFLIVSIVLVFISGISFIVGNGASTVSPAFQDIYNQSGLAQVLVNHYSVWFVLPAVIFAGVSLKATAGEN
ncbi:hypothetical protein KKD70_04365 [Patescibacteria group bacterium]|nr:hypothetical protein [Patescibacteria group bacterium]